MTRYISGKKIAIWGGCIGGIALIAFLVWVSGRPAPFFASVPPGYTGKVLTPSGWDTRILEAGQVDLGALGNGGIGNSLVVMEGVTTTVREKFEEAATNDDPGDDRVLTKDGVPLTLTVYIRLTAPTDEQRQNVIFEQMTSGTSENRVSSIMLQDVYNRFAKMDVRNRVRAIIASYSDYKTLYADFDGANQRINEAVGAVFERNDVPLVFQNAGISNAKPDQKVWDAENEKVAAQARADAMRIISEAASTDPNNLITLKWQYLQKIAEVSAASGSKLIIISDISSPEVVRQIAAEASQP
jgi:regulator of protease activity HflC (stomatin/prohibitin superfamily)